MWTTGRTHKISIAYVHMATLENAKEQSKEPDEAGRTTMGGI